MPLPYTHIFAPTKGIMTNFPPSFLPKDASPFAQGVYMKDGVVSSDFGHTEYPTPGALMTNFLNGSIMRIDQFYTLSGLSFLLAFTTTNLYQYNTSNTTWDCVTQGVTVEDCEDAWTANASVTATAETTPKLRGTKAAKIVIASGFTTGVAAYENFSSADLSGYTALHFWIRADAATLATDLDIRISEQNAGGTGASYEDVSVPALEADTWTPVCITFAGATATRDAVLSVALIVATDQGAITVNIDDVRAVVEFTGDEDNRFSVATMNDTFLFTNGIDQPGKITEAGGVITVADLSTTLATGTISTSEIVFAFKDHVVLLNNTENAADAPQRASWTNIGSLDDYINGTAGYQDLVDNEDWIIAAAMLSENEYAIYKERSIIIMLWVGGATPFRFYTMVEGVGAISKEGITSRGGDHVILGQDSLFSYDGGREVTFMDDNVKKTMYARLDGQYSARTFLLFLEEDNELQVWLPTSTVYPDDVWCIEFNKESWYRKSRTMTGFGYYQAQSSLTIGELVGTIGEQNWRFGDTLTKAYTPITLVGDNNGKVYKLDKLTLNNNGVAITNEFQTPDFVLPETEEYMNHFMRVPQLIFEASGQSVTTHWSDDGGLTWNPTEGGGANTTTLDSVVRDYQQDFDCVVKRIRFRFRNTMVSSGFNLSYYGFKLVIRSGRK